MPRRGRPRPVGARGLRRARQRARRRLPDGVAGRMATRRPHRRHALLAARRPPTRSLAPGDRVRLTVAGAGDPIDPAPVRAPAWSPPPSARLVLEVVTPGLRAVVQDGGRRGVAAVGVPRRGPGRSGLLHSGQPSGRQRGRLRDDRGHRRRDAAARLGPVPRRRRRCRARGARRRRGGPGRPGAPPRRRPACSRWGRLRRGCRTYVAVAGGLVGPAAFGSSASDELCGLGAGPLAPGQPLYAGPWAPPLGDHLAPGAASERRRRWRPVAPPRRAGPAPRVVRPRRARAARRNAVRRRGGQQPGRDQAARGGRRDHVATARRGSGELDSQGVVTGAVQVPPGGEPVILMPDHATLGGYPVLAVVVSADHGLLGQCAPGTRVRLVPIGHDEAAAAWPAPATRRRGCGRRPLPAVGRVSEIRPAA